MKVGPSAFVYLHRGHVYLLFAVREDANTQACNNCNVSRQNTTIPSSAFRAYFNYERRNVPCQFNPRKKRGPRVSRAQSTVRGELKIAMARISECSWLLVTIHSLSSLHGLFSNVVCPQTSSYSDDVSKQLRPAIASAVPRKLFVDHLLEDGSDFGNRQNTTSILKV